MIFDTVIRWKETGNCSFFDGIPTDREILFVHVDGTIFKGSLRKYFLNAEEVRWFESEDRIFKCSDIKLWAEVPKVRL